MVHIFFLSGKIVQAIFAQLFSRGISYCFFSIYFCGLCFLSSFRFIAKVQSAHICAAFPLSTFRTIVVFAAVSSPATMPYDHTKLHSWTCAHSAGFDQCIMISIYHWHLLVFCLLLENSCTWKVNTASKVKAEELNK